MKITNIELYSNNKSVANFSFRDPSAKNPYIAQNVFGLDADEIVPKFYGLSNNGLNKNYDMAVKSRDVVIRIALNPQFSEGKTYSDLRDDLYRAISSSRTGMVHLRLKNGLSNVAGISGFITKFETPLFNQLPEVQITIKCEDPMIRSIEPFYTDQLNLGIQGTLVDNVSTAPHGFSFSLTYNSDSNAFSIFNGIPQEWVFTVTPGTIGANTGFKTNDVLYFSSEFQNRQIYIVRSGATIHLVDKINAGSSWPVLFPGENDYQISTNAFTWNYLTYYQTFWGV